MARKFGSIYLMTPKILICDRCFERIALKKPNYAKFWYDLCIAASKDKRLPRPKEKIARFHFDQAIQYLEREGYLVTTETGQDDYITKMLGFAIIEKEDEKTIWDTFCIDEDHLDEIEDTV